jgi:hypothetical protein
MQRVAQPLIPAVTMTFSQGVTPFALHPVNSSSFVNIVQADMNDTETENISVYLTPDIRRTRAYSVRYIYTPHVHFEFVVN